jgi:hypothetical protein
MDLEGLEGGITEIVASCPHAEDFIAVKSSKWKDEACRPQHGVPDLERLLVSLPMMPPGARTPFCFGEDKTPNN